MIRKMKNGQYDIHLDFMDAYRIKELLKDFLEQNKTDPFACQSYSKLYKEFEEALGSDEQYLISRYKAAQNYCGSITQPELFTPYLPQKKDEFKEIPDYEETVYPVSFSWCRDNAILTCDAGNGYSKDITIEPNSQACNFIKSQAWENKPMIITMHQVGFYTCGIKARFKEN